MKSIVNYDKQCRICGSRQDIHKHHIFFGSANRKLSEKYGCWVYLCQYHHNGSNEGVHYNYGLDQLLKKTAQRRWEEIYGSREDFRKIFGRSYL